MAWWVVDPRAEAPWEFEGWTRGLGKEGSLAAVDAHDGLAAQNPGWIGAGGEGFEAAAVLAL